VTIEKKAKLYIVPAVAVFFFYTAVWAIPTPKGNFYYTDKGTVLAIQSDTVAIEASHIARFSIPDPPPDTSLHVPVSQPDNNPLNEEHNHSPFHLNDPPTLQNSIEYDPNTNSYNFQNKIGETPYGPGASMSIDEFIDYDLRQSIHDYWKSKGAGYVNPQNRRGGGLIPQLKIGGDVFESIFGSNVIDIRPSGNAELIFGIVHRRNNNYALPVKQRRSTNFNFDEKIQLNLLAKIGDKIEFNLNYNTESNFNFDNKMKLKYEGKEDDIIQLIEFGDVTLPLNSSLITGSQSLFGLKTQLKFGKLLITAVASQQNAEKQTITVSSGAQENQFYFKADEYEDNRHFFISQFFRNHYNQYLSTLPLVGSPIVITKIEVWRTTIGAATTENRNIVAFTDLAENGSNFPMFSNRGELPQDNYDTLQNGLIRNISAVSNNLRNLGMVAGKDYEKVENARLLLPSEYSFNSKLGFISLNTALPADQVLAVAFQYSVIGDNKVYQVGEFSNEVQSPNCLRVKLLKSTNLDTKSPLWKLMMKNVYNLNTYQLSSEKFRLNILFTGDEEGIANGFFNTGSQKGIPLIRLMGLDRLNQQQDPNPDGIFDYIDGASINGGTIDSRTGRIYFPTIEPFGKDLRAVLTEPTVADKYAFDSLYTMTKAMAQQITNKNKYFLEGSFKSSYGAEYYLGAFNVPEGSVKVTAGGITLQENVQYTVNYSAGSVTIIDESILKSGTPISISLENRNDMMNKKTMFGLNLDYLFSKDFTVGATLLNLSERPITEKVDYGEEPINNLIWGMNLAYKTRVPFVTKLVDWLPFHSTTAESNFQINAEFAHFVPGHSRSIGKQGTTYIDDFESAKSSVDLRNIGSWVMASTPQGQIDLFPEARPMSSSDPARRQLAYGYNRAKLAWYVIDPIFYRDDNTTPSNLSKADLSKPYVRSVYETELFPYKQVENASLMPSMSVLNFAFYPSERGPYNYDVAGAEGFSRGTNADGSLKDPNTRWGGIMRKMDYTDFESSNYEYIEFWMMDPFIENPNHAGGKLYFNLGDISEDILRDGKKSFENGLPIDGSDSQIEWTVWGRVPTLQKLVNGFDPDPDARQYQDVGFDGLQDNREREHFDDYLAMLSALHGPQSAAYLNAMEDPSSDNYHYFRGSDYDAADAKVLERYKKYNNPEGNSPTDQQSPERYPTGSTNQPNVEDVNNDNTLSEDEKYYQYVIDLQPSSMVVGQNYINDMYEAVPGVQPDGSRPMTKWYQFRIPLKHPDKVVGNITGFNSIRFLRVFMKDFSEPVVCRLATFELVRSDWRTYNLDLYEPGSYLSGQGEETQFSVATINYEENSNRMPVPYVLPPGVKRETMVGMSQSYKINEQSLTLKIDKLNDGDARAVYKNVNYDLRRYKRLQMFIHAEDLHTSGELEKNNIAVFIRLGSDFTDNYYEYEIPVDITPWNVGIDSTRIWPEANRMNIVLDSLVNIKQRRNIAVRRGQHPNNQEHYIYKLLNGDKITVVGMPNLAEVSTIMIGVRNPKKQSRDDGDDMNPKSVEVWLNELCLNDFDEKSGFAAMGQMRLNLADIGDISFSTSYSTPGFGTLESTIANRQKETRYSIDVATNIDGGKVLFPEKWNIKMPVHYDYSLNMELPQYNPLNPDVKFKDDLQTYNSKSERDSIRHMTTNMIQRQNVNIMNVRKERNLDKPVKFRPWDVENLDFSYSYSETKKRDVDVEFDNEFIHEGQIGYTFNHNPKNYRPLSKVKGLGSKWLQIFRDLNFTPMPKSLIIRTTLNRSMNTFKYRPKSQGNIIIDTSFVKNFDWNRTYSFNWDLTQGLKFEYQAQASARIDEPQGLIDTRSERDSVWKSFGNGGRTTVFNQRVNITYMLPLNKIPLFNWITANAGYTGTYNYSASALSLAYLGNTISNSNTVNGTATVNFVTLYNNIPYLKKVNQGLNRPNQRKPAPAAKVGGKPATNTQDTKAKTAKDSIKEKRAAIGRLILNGSLRFLMMVRNASLTYTEGHGSTLPGYLHEPNLFGINFQTASPGFLYVFGGQPDIRRMAAAGNWITKDTLLNTAYQERMQRNISFRVSVEPFNDVRIDVTAMQNTTKDFTEYFRADAAGELHHYSPQFNGTFTSSYIALGSFFKNGTDIFKEFSSARSKIATRLAHQNSNSSGRTDPNTGYPDGYGGVQQDVLSAAFLAAYGHRDINKINVSSPFLKIPLPNWRLAYNGFTKLKGVNKYFQSLTLNHVYSCTYTIGNYTSDLNYSEINGMPSARNNLGNFIPTYAIGQISINEQFNPLIGLEMTLKNSLMFKVDFKMTRNLALSFVNNQITETSSKELVVRAGYSFKDIKIGFIFSGMKRQIVSDLNLTAGFGIRDNITTLRKVDEFDRLVSSGQLAITIDFNADYQISRMVGLRLYYNHAINRPYVNSYQNSNLDCGISVRLMLSQ
jgi:cell surface protein SprA